MATEKIIKTSFKFRRGLSNTWLYENPILEEGEPGFEVDTYKLKIGDGITPWKDLPYTNEAEDEEGYPITNEQIKSLFSKGE